MNFNQETIENLEKKIEFWTNKLNNSRDSVEIAELDSKISLARKEIVKLKVKNDKLEIKDQIEAPSVADRTSDYHVTLCRGQIMNSGNVYNAIL